MQVAREGHRIDHAGPHAHLLEQLEGPERLLEGPGMVPEPIVRLLQAIDTGEDTVNPRSG
jgi:hypothetical protein